jgi:hypothetical protein
MHVLRTVNCAARQPQAPDIQQAVAADDEQAEELQRQASHETPWFVGVQEAEELRRTLDSHDQQGLDGTWRSMMTKEHRGQYK